MVLRSIEKNFKGKIIVLPRVCSHGGGKSKIEAKTEIKLIRAAYGRSIAVTKDGHVYCWGQGFRNEHIPKPVLIFEDSNGIFDLQFGLKHGIYIQEKNKKVYSWGDGTIGQTGNDHTDSFGFGNQQTDTSSAHSHV